MSPEEPKSPATTTPTASPKVRSKKAPGDAVGAPPETSPETAATESHQPPKRSRRLVLAVAGAAVVVLAGVTTAVVMSRGTAEAPMDGSGAYLVGAFAATPEVAWSFDYGSGDTTAHFGAPTLVTIDADRALLLTNYSYDDYLAQEGGGWYLAYDADFDAGTLAGQKYAADLAAWDVGYQAFLDTHKYLGRVGVEGFYGLASGKIMPREDDYYPQDDFGFAIKDQPKGWLDGFGAGKEGGDPEAARLEKPADPTFLGGISLIDLDTGEAIWTVPLSTIQPAATFRTQGLATAIRGTKYAGVYLITLSADGTSAERTLVSLDLGTGKVVGTAETGRSTTIGGVDGGLFVRVAGNDEEGDEWVARFDPADLDAGPVWKRDLAGTTGVMFIGDYTVAVKADGTAHVLNADDGTDAAWGADYGDPGVSYASVAGSLVRLAYTDPAEETAADPTSDAPVVVLSSTEQSVEGVNAQGERTWITPENVWLTYSDRDLLLVADLVDGKYASLRRLDPATGEDMWSEPSAAEISSIVTSFGDIVLARRYVEGEWSLVTIDANTGKEISSTPMTPPISYLLGEDFYALDEEGTVTAYDTAGPGTVWTYTYDPESGEALTTLGAHMIIKEEGSHSISGLG